MSWIYGMIFILIQISSKSTIRNQHVVSATPLLQGNINLFVVCTCTSCCCETRVESQSLSLLIWIILCVRLCWFMSNLKTLMWFLQRLLPDKCSKGKFLSREAFRISQETLHKSIWLHETWLSSIKSSTSNCRRASPIMSLESNWDKAKRQIEINSNYEIKKEKNERSL